LLGWLKNEYDETNYAYDPNGNITYDAQRGLTMTYNHLNLPSRTTMPDNSRVDNIYDANGVKWQRILRMLRVAP
jgi:hypothetical protein